MKFSSIFSVRNILRTSGIVTLCVGTPMILAPALMVECFFNKREDSSEADKKALDVSVQALGVGLAASGAKSLLAPVSKKALGAALYMEALYSCYHCMNRCFGRIKDAKGNIDKSTLYLCVNLTVVAVQVLSLCCGEEPEEEEKEQ